MDELIEKMAAAMRSEVAWLIQQDENAEGLNATDSSRDLARAGLDALKAAGNEMVNASRLTQAFIATGWMDHYAPQDYAAEVMEALAAARAAEAAQ